MQADRATLTLSLASAVALACACLAPCADAAPFIPSDDAQVLERLPSRSAAEFRDLKALQAAAAKAPGELAPAIALANAYVRASRVEGDPRFLGYAQAALARWWKDPQAPTPVLLLRATILQSNHEFDAAVADLGLVLQREPRQRAGTADPRHGADGAGQVRACARRLHAPRRRRAVDLRRDLHRGDRRDDRQRVVRLRLGAEGTARRCPASTPRRPTGGRRCSPKSHIVAATPPRKRTSRRRSRPTRPTCTRSRRTRTGCSTSDARPTSWLCSRIARRIDILLLRLALAQQALKSAEAAASIQTLRARFDASHARGDTVHLRENARFELWLNGDARSALRYAIDNQKVQREAADLRILAEAAAAANDAAALDLARRWLDDTRIEYPAVAAIARGATSPPTGSAAPRGARRPRRAFARRRLQRPRPPHREPDRRHEALADGVGTAARRVDGAGARAQAFRQLPHAARRRRHDRRAMGHRVARPRLRARPGREPGRRHHVGRGQGEARGDRRLRAVAAAPRPRGRALPRQRDRAPRRRSQRRRVRGDPLQRNLRGGAQVARRRLSPVLRHRPAASRAAAARIPGRDPRRHLLGGSPDQSFTLGAASKWEQFLDYGNEGVWHIWTGFDHILFLLSLLLPAVLVRSTIPGSAGSRRRASRTPSGTW